MFSGTMGKTELASALFVNFDTFSKRTIRTFPVQVLPLLRALELIGSKDVELSKTLSAMGDPPNLRKRSKVSRSQIGNWRMGRENIPKKHIPKIVALVEHSLKHLPRLANLAGEPRTSDCWVRYKEAREIIEEALNDPEIARYMSIYREQFADIFEKTTAGKNFLLEQEKKAHKWGGREQ